MSDQRWSCGQEQVVVSTDDVCSEKETVAGCLFVRLDVMAGSMML